MKSTILVNDNDIFNHDIDMNKLHLKYYSKIINSIDNGLIIKMISEILNNNNQLIDNSNEDEYKIKVNIVSAKANQLINRIVQEGEYTNADILLTTDVGRLHIAKEKNIFQKINSTTLTNLVPSNYRDKDNYWFGVSLRARLLIYNRNSIDKSDLNGYIDLAKNKWKNNFHARHK